MGCVVLALLGAAWGARADTLFRVGLWGESSPVRIESLRRGLLRAVGSELRAAGFTGIDVECSADYERRFADLRQGRFALLEAEPATYFLVRRRWLAYDAQRWQYELAFQGLSSPSQPSMLRGTIVSLSRSGPRSPQDLRGRILGILSPYGLGSGGIQLAALKRLGLERERDFQVLQADSERSLCKSLFSGLVDAVALPEGRPEAFLAKEGAGRTSADGLIVLYRSDLLPGPVWCVHRQLVQDYPDLVAQLRRRLPSAWTEEALLPSRDAYYRTTLEWVDSLEEL